MQVEDIDYIVKLVPTIEEFMVTHEMSHLYRLFRMSRSKVQELLSEIRRLHRLQFFSRQRLPELVLHSLYADSKKTVR